MQNLNLFGVPIEDGDDSAKKTGSTDAKKALKELLEVTESLDDGKLANFNCRKSFSYFDVKKIILTWFQPYNPDEEVTYTFLKFEDELKLRASIVLDFYRQDILALADEDLTVADKELKQ